MSLWAISSKKRPVAEAPTEAARVAAISAMQHESTLKTFLETLKKQHLIFHEITLKTLLKCP